MVLDHELKCWLGLLIIQRKTKGWRWVDRQFSWGGFRLLTQDLAICEGRFICIVLFKGIIRCLLCIPLGRSGDGWLPLAHAMLEMDYFGGELFNPSTKAARSKNQRMGWNQTDRSFDIICQCGLWKLRQNESVVLSKSCNAVTWEEAEASMGKLCNFISQILVVSDDKAVCCVGNTLNRDIWCYSDWGAHLYLSLGSWHQCGENRRWSMVF